MAGAAPVFPSLRFAHARGFAHRLAIGWGPLGAPSRPTWVGTAAEPRCRRARGHFFISIASVAQTLQRTPLFDRHVALGARMVPFAGWEMPVQYDGVIPEHRAVRGDCGVFDVSHMGEIEVEGMHAPAVLQAALSNDISKLVVGDAQYTLLTNERGGIVDDLIVYRTDEWR